MVDQRFVDHRIEAHDRSLPPAKRPRRTRPGVEGATGKAGWCRDSPWLRAEWRA